MSHYCRPLLTAQDCLRSLAMECGVENLHTSLQGQLRASDRVVTYICREHVDGIGSERFDV